MIQDQNIHSALRYYDAGTDSHEQWEVEREEQKRKMGREIKCSVWMEGRLRNGGIGGEKW